MMPTCPWMGDNMGDNMAVQRWANRRPWNGLWSGIVPNGGLHHFPGPPPNIQQGPPLINRSWNNMVPPPPNGYWTPPNAFQYRPNTRFSVQHLRSRRINRLSRAYRHNGSRYHYMDSDESSDDDYNERRENHAANNENRQNNDDNNNNNHELIEEDEERCFICGEAMHNCDEVRVHMCAGDTEEVLSDPESVDTHSMDVCDNKKEKTKSDNEPRAGTSSSSAERDLIETMKAALMQEKEQVTNLRKDASDVLKRLTDKETRLLKLEKELKEKEKKLEEKHAENMTEMKRLEQQLQDECRRMEEEHEIQKGRIKLDIGGHVFTTSTSTLSIDPNSMLAAMFSGRHDVIKQADGTVFIDRDGTHFRYILNYLRDGPASLDTLPRPRQMLKELRNEAAFYQLPGLVQQIEKLLN